MSEVVNTNKRRFIEALVETGSVSEAAAAAGVVERTGYRYLLCSDVRAALAKITGAAYAELAAKASRMASDCLTTLHDITTADEPPKHRGVQVRAALGLLDVALKLRDVVHVDARLQAIEVQLEQLQGVKR